MDDAQELSIYRRPTFKCVVKRLLFRVFKEIVNSIIANREKIRIRICIYCILSFICGPTVYMEVSMDVCTKVHNATRKTMHELHYPIHKLVMP